MECWVTLYTGYPHDMCLDQEVATAGEAFRLLAYDNGIILQFSGTEYHNSRGVGERYHTRLWRVFSDVRRTHPQLHPEASLRMARTGMNDTMGPDGLSLLYWSLSHYLPYELVHIHSPFNACRSPHSVRGGTKWVPSFPIRSLPRPHLAPPSIHEVSRLTRGSIARRERRQKDLGGTSHVPSGSREPGIAGG